MMATGAVEEVVEVGYFGAGRLIPCDELSAGMVGYITASIKNVRDTRVGDTVTDADRPCAEALPGYKKSTRWYTAACTRPTAHSTAICATRWKTAVKRCIPLLRAGDIGSTGLWLPLRFPWTASPGNYSGAPGA